MKTMKYYKKYNFHSKQQADDLINALGTMEGEDGLTYNLHNHSIVRLGFLPIEDAVYDENGNVITHTVFSEKYSVDVLWSDLEVDNEEEPIYPVGWSEYTTTGLENYKHEFSSYKYED